MEFREECCCGDCACTVPIPELTEDDMLKSTKKEKNMVLIKNDPKMVIGEVVKMDLTDINAIARESLLNKVHYLEERLAAVQKRSNQRKRALRQLHKAHEGTLYKLVRAYKDIETLGEVLRRSNRDKGPRYLIDNTHFGFWKSVLPPFISHLIGL